MILYGKLGSPQSGRKAQVLFSRKRDEAPVKAWARKRRDVTYPLRAFWDGGRVPRRLQNVSKTPVDSRRFGEMAEN